MSQNGNTNFKNLATFASRFLKYVMCDHFGRLCIKGYLFIYVVQKLYIPF